MKTDKAPKRRSGAKLPTGSGEQIFTGHGVSAGIAIGPAHVMDSGLVSVPEFRVAKNKIGAECARFKDAVEVSRGQVKKLQAKTRESSGAGAAELEYLLEAHLQMLSGSRLVRGVEERIRRDRLNAEAAVQACVVEIGEVFAGIGDPYLAARMQDIQDVGKRLLRSLTKTPYKTFGDIARDAIILADEITPADTALIDPKRAGGFATALGGAESHTAIMARSMGLPAVLGASEVARAAKPGDLVIVDGDRGRVIIDPAPATVAAYERRREALKRERRMLARLRDMPAITSDGVEITLQANIELPLEFSHALQAGAGGVGLLRSEFLYMNREDLPDAEEQYLAFRDLVEGMAGRSVTIRTLDLGGDKLAAPLGRHFANSPNPALGLRAIRLSLRLRDLLETQLTAILRAGAHGPVRILLPMISSVSEVRQVRAALKRLARKLTGQGVKIADPLPPLGVMIEIPAAALAADGLARAADFFSIGTNDLTMYTLAIDRGDEQVADYYNPLHPAVLRLIRMSIVAAGQAGLPINLCGEMAGDPRYAPLLLGLGLRDLSMASANLLRVKKRIRALDLADAERRAENILRQTDAGRIAALLDDLEDAG
jgi:phosphotransferase system enzyme I (PtsI)